MVKNARPRLISEIRSTNAFSDCVAPSMNVLMRMPALVQRTHLAQRRLDRLAHRRVVEEHLAVGR